MAPKGSPDVRSLQRSLQSLTQQVASLSKGTAKGKGNNWSCSACAEGANNYPHRTTCFKCGAPKPAGSRPPGSQAAGSGKARAKSRPAPAQPLEDAARRSTPAPSYLEVAESSQAGSQSETAEQDPVAIELAVAKSLHLWALRLKEPARSTELPKAEKRLADAQAANQERRPPAERLRAALSRVEAKQKRLDEAKTVSKQASAALETAQGDEEQAEEQLQEAQQELATAQAMHVEATRTTPAGAAGSPAPAVDGRMYLGSVLKSLQPGSEQADLLLKFLEASKNGLPPPYPSSQPGSGLASEPPSGTRGPPTPVPTPNPRPPGRRSSERATRSRSRSREADPGPEGTAGDAAMGAAGGA